MSRGGFRGACAAALIVSAGCLDALYDGSGPRAPRPVIPTEDGGADGGADGGDGGSSLSCTGERCGCDAGQCTCTSLASPCEASCGDGCQFSCFTPLSCTVDAGADSVVTCSGAGPCELTAAAGSTLTCSTSSRCNVTCRGTCLVSCPLGSPCDIACPDGVALVDCFLPGLKACGSCQ